MIFLTEPVYAACSEAVSKYRYESFPAIIPIPGVTGNTGLGLRSVSKSVEKAVGSDIIGA